MLSNTFLPDFGVLMYAALSVLLGLFIYKARHFSRFDWHAPEMNAVAGSGKMDPVDINSGDPARNAAVAAANVANSLSAANGASLLVLGVFLLGCFMGAVALPAALGMMTSITTLNLASLIVAGCAWGLGLGRLTLSLVRLGFKLALGLALLVAALFALNFVLGFLSGGADVFWNGTVGGLKSAADTVYHYDTAPQGSWLYRYEDRRKYNLCAVYQGIRSMGDIQHVRAQCDVGTDAAERKRIQAAAEQGRQKFEKDQQDARARVVAALRKLSGGVPDTVVPYFAKTPNGTWRALSYCPNSDKPRLAYQLSFTGEPSALRGVVLILPQGVDFDESKISAYRFVGTQDGMTVSVQATDWIQQGTAGRKRDMQLRLVAQKPSHLVEDLQVDGCSGISFNGVSVLN